MENCPQSLSVHYFHIINHEKIEKGIRNLKMMLPDSHLQQLSEA